jgi:ferredoxin/flavodoxin---NADP+ reductase
MQTTTDAVIVGREDHSPSLATFTVALRGPAFSFLPGQYATLGLPVGDAVVERHYSIASSPSTAFEGYALYVRLVDGGHLTPALFRAKTGDPVTLRGPRGKFTLRLDDPRPLVCVSTGTGIAPFLSMVRTLLAQGSTRRILMLQGVRHPVDLTHLPLLRCWEEATGGRLEYRPTVSRPGDPESAGWQGASGRVERALELCLSEEACGPGKAAFYVCGNPAMVEGVAEILRARGYPRPDVRTELYWARPRKGPGGVGEAIAP